VLTDPDQAARGPAGLPAGWDGPAMQHADRRLLPQDNLKHTYLTDSSEALLGSVDLRGGYLHQYLERLSLQRLKQATLFPPVSEQRPVSINFLPVRPRPRRAFERPAGLQIPARAVSCHWTATAMRARARHRAALSCSLPRRDMHCDRALPRPEASELPAPGLRAGAQGRAGALHRRAGALRARSSRLSGRRASAGGELRA